MTYNSPVARSLAVARKSGSELDSGAFSLRSQPLEAFVRTDTLTCYSTFAFFDQVAVHRIIDNESHSEVDKKKPLFATCDALARVSKQHDNMLTPMMYAMTC